MVLSYFFVDIRQFAVSNAIYTPKIQIFLHIPINAYQAYLHFSYFLFLGRINSKATRIILSKPKGYVGN